MVIVSTLGFLFTSQFVTLPGLEAPYYIVMLGLAALKLLNAEPGSDDADAGETRERFRPSALA
jgi:hypothetical protein